MTRTPVLLHKTDASMTDTIAAMTRLALAARRDVELRKIVTDICADLAEGDYAGEALAINNYVKQHVRYIRDPDGVEFVQTPRRTLDVGSGDCDDIATLLAAMLMLAGNQVQFAVAAFATVGGRPAFSHVYVEVVTPHGVIVLDPVANRDTKQMINSIKSKLTFPVGNSPGTMDAGIRGVLGRPLGQAPHVSVGGKNVYSVFDHERGIYEYFEGPRKELPATGRFRPPRRANPMGIAPDDIAAPLPTFARKVGVGPTPRGIIASKPTTVLGAVSPQTRRYVVVATVSGLLVWLALRRK
jgi:hypothetical protein